MGINKRASLRKFVDDIRRWVEEDRSDEWIASALATSASSVQSFRSRNAIYRRGATSTLYGPKDFSSYEGVLDPEGPGIWSDPEIGSDPRWQKRWDGTERVELRLTPGRIVLLRRGETRGPASRWGEHFPACPGPRSGGLAPGEPIQESPCCIRGHHRHRTGALRTSERAL